MTFALPILVTSIETFTSCPGQASVWFTYKLEYLNAAITEKGTGVGDVEDEGEAEGGEVGFGDGVN